jgi:hypothetical protein
VFMMRGKCVWTVRAQRSAQRDLDKLNLKRGGLWSARAMPPCTLPPSSPLPDTTISSTTRRAHPRPHALALGDGPFDAAPAPPKRRVAGALYTSVVGSLDKSFCMPPPLTDIRTGTSSSIHPLRIYQSPKNIPAAAAASSGGSAPAHKPAKAPPRLSTRVVPPAASPLGPRLARGGSGLQANVGGGVYVTGSIKSLVGRTWADVIRVR